MNKLLSAKRIEVYIVIAIMVVIALVVVFSDTSNLQSAQEITISIKPCELVDGTLVETVQFEVGHTHHICGEVLSEYLPLELNYYLVSSTNDDVVLSEYIKVTTYEFTVDLPVNLDIGQYKFEIKSGRRKHIVTTYFGITR